MQAAAASAVEIPAVITNSGSVQNIQQNQNLHQQSQAIQQNQVQLQQVQEVQQTNQNRNSESRDNIQQGNELSSNHNQSQQQLVPALVSTESNQGVTVGLVKLFLNK